MNTTMTIVEENMTTVIKKYLKKKGKMSGRDIVDDCCVEECDIDFAKRSGDIQRVTSCPGGSGPWYLAK